MKKLFSILFALQIAILFLFTAYTPAHAGWERGMYEEHMYGNNMMYDQWDNGHHFPLFWLMKHHDNSSFAFVSLYKLGVDIILSILFIMLFSKFIMGVFAHMKAKPFKSGYVGFTFLVIFPLISIILLGLVWLGVAALLSYGLIFLIGIFLTKIFIGWAILSRLEKDYVLDWKAGLAGPLVVFILLFIPILGWLTVAVILSMATGALLKEILPLLEKQKLEHRASKKA